VVVIYNTSTAAACVSVCDTISILAVALLHLIAAMQQPLVVLMVLMILLVVGTITAPTAVALVAQ
jgi:hypothetical protein